jgi:signal transduction histidine kinase
MDTELGIIYNLRDHFKVGLLRSDGRGFLYMNAEALAMFGFSTLDEAVAQPRRILFADCDSYQHLLTKQKAYGAITNERVLFIRQDRTSFWGLLTSRITEVNGEVYYDEMIVDASAQVNSERKLIEKTHLLEKVGNELDRFIYSASHDLRSPISSMKGLLNLYRMNDEIFTCSQFLDMMEASLNNLECFIRMLVDFSKTTNQPVVIEPVNLEKVINGILKNLKTHPSNGKVHVECVTSGAAVVHSDLNKVYTILSNVIRNAFDFLDPAKGSGLVSIKAHVSNAKATVEVIDNGIGIDKRFIPTVFQMFYRASSLSKGSGLGLYVAREAIVRLGGNINIRSEYGLGTFVNIQIPNEIDKAYDNDDVGPKAT